MSPIIIDKKIKNLVFPVSYLEPSFPLREQVDAMIEEMQKEQALNFSRIARFCTLQGYTITSPSVRTYYNKYYKLGRVP